MKLLNHKNIVYITPSHQFPTGYVMDLKSELTNTMGPRKEERFIIEDDYDSEFRYFW